MPRARPAPTSAHLDAAPTAGWGPGPLANLQAPAVLLDEGGRVLDANLPALELLQAEEATLVGGPIDRFLAPRDGAALGEALAQGTCPAWLEVDGRRASGEAVPLELTLLPSGAPAGWLALLRDVTPRRQAERDLRYDKAVLESQNEASIDGILIVDQDSQVVSVNHRFLEMWGVPEDLLRRGASDEEALGSVLGKLDDPDEFLAKIAWLADHPQAETRDEVWFRDGRVFERWSAPVTGPDGTLHGRGWYFRDTTERVRAEAALRRTTDQLQEADRFRTQLINNISHDLGTPLTPIKIQLYLLQRALGDASPDQARALDILQRNFEQIRRLVSDLRDVARLQGGRLKLERAPLELNRLVTEGVATFQPLAASRGVALDVRVGPEVHPLADAGRVMQVLFNLVSNALKFTPPGGRVVVSTEVAGAEVRLSVRDSGRGLTPAEQERLFKPFSQAHDPSETAERGTGLGLYISRGIAEQHGGRVWAESAGRGKGSSFVLALPLTPPDAARADR